MITAVSHVMLYVTDLSRSTHWYQDVLGFVEAYSAPDVYASLWNDDLEFRLDLHATRAGDPHLARGPILYFNTDNLDAALAQLKQQNVPTTTPRREGTNPRFSTFLDPDGNRLGLEEDE
jgi:catechol 2,3-dioxygenase-like lactoylglutathione lyase family enzyme